MPAARVPRPRTHPGRAPAFPTSPQEGRRLAAAFRQAAEAGDAQALMQLLAKDAVLYTVNGLAGFVMREPDGSINTMAFEHHAGHIIAIYLVRNPEKLRHVRF